MRKGQQYSINQYKKLDIVLFEDIYSEAFSAHPWLKKALSFIHSCYFHSVSSSPLLLRGAPDTARILSEFHTKAPQATASEGLPLGPTRCLDRDSNLRPFRRKVPNLPMGHHAPPLVCSIGPFREV